ncbi:hypothetical protein TNCV_3933951 [Trichonephila clavipes]|nr:hypothetical protein TNCV_3933951 [Trichonephila clavipes]
MASEEEILCIKVSVSWRVCNKSAVSKLPPRICSMMLVSSSVEKCASTPLCTTIRSNVQWQVFPTAGVDRLFQGYGLLLNFSSYCRHLVLEAHTREAEGFSGPLADHTLAILNDSRRRNPMN